MDSTRLWCLMKQRGQMDQHGVWGSEQRAGRVRVGSQQKQHVPDRIWRWQAHCERLAGSMPWRKVFWSQWGCLHVLHCSCCSTHFQARHLNQCWFHPDPIQFCSTGPGGKPQIDAFKLCIACKLVYNLCIACMLVYIRERERAVHSASIGYPST